MIKLIEDKPLREKLAGNSREMIVNRFEQKYVWNEILKEYRLLEQEYQDKLNNRNIIK